MIAIGSPSWVQALTATRYCMSAQFHAGRVVRYHFPFLLDRARCAMGWPSAHARMTVAARAAAGLVRLARLQLAPLGG